jgi:hypothetical protein
VVTSERRRAIDLDEAVRFQSGEESERGAGAVADEGAELERSGEEARSGGEESDDGSEARRLDVSRGATATAAAAARRRIVDRLEFVERARAAAFGAAQLVDVALGASFRLHA